MFGIDDALIASAAIGTGSRLIGAIVGEIQGTPELESLNWEAERTLFMGRLREAIEARGEEATSRARLEAERIGTPMGGSYLQAVTDIEKNLNELFAKEVGTFEIQQAGAKREWAGKQAMVKLQGQQAQNRMWQEVIGGIGGDISGAITAQWEGNLFENYYGRTVSPLEGLENIDRNVPSDIMERLIEDMYKEVFNYTPSFA